MRDALLLPFVTSLLILAGCGREGVGARAPSPTARLIADESAPREARLDAIQDLRAPVSQDVVDALLLAMNDRSQQAFVTVPDDSALGFHVEESPFGGPDERADVRWEAIIALERLGVRAAIPDLWSAIHDRHPVVRNHAAHALWHFGYPAALEVLVKALDGRALENETANGMLVAITGEDFGFDTDGGFAAKAEAIARWRGHFAEKGYPRAAPAPRAGEDAALDRRIRFLVDVLGQHQFLFMEQSRRNLSAMGEIAVDHLRPVLVGDRMSRNQTLRAYAVQVLESIGSPSARELLRRLLDDADASVRQRAAAALGELADADAGSALIVRLADEDESVVLAAARSLGKAGVRSGEDALRRLLGASTAASRLRLTAACSLLELGLGRGPAAELVLDRLRHGDISERVELADFLKSWRGDLLGYDANRAGTEQQEALARWVSALQ